MSIYLIQGGPIKNKQISKCDYLKSLYPFTVKSSAFVPHQTRLLQSKERENPTSRSEDMLILLIPGQKQSKQLAFFPRFE